MTGSRVVPSDETTDPLRASNRARPCLAETSSWQGNRRPDCEHEMRKDVREFIRRLEAVGLTVRGDAGEL